MDGIPSSPTKSSPDGLEMSSDSNLEIEVSEQSFILQLIKDNLLLVVTLTGVVCGTISGLILRNYQPSEDSILIISYPGEIFMRILKLIILPLVVSSLISCSASLNAKLNGKIAVKTLSYFVLTSFFNSCLGIILALLIHPGNQESKTTLELEKDKKIINVLDNFLDIGRNMFPDNIFQAFFQQTHTVYVPVKPLNKNDTLNNNTDFDNTNSESSFKMMRTLHPRDGSNNIGIIISCLVFGTVLGTIQPSTGEPVINFFRCIYEVVMKIMSGIMWLTPIGICSVICGKILSVNDLGIVIAQLGWFVFTVVIGLIIYQFIALQLLYFIIIRRNPFKFYWDLAPAMLTAFATASTAAALPVTFQCMDEKLKIDQRISRFILPIGCSINMDGTALFLSSATIFISQLNSMTLSASEIITVSLVSTAASMSSASVPSAALVLMLMMLTSIGCPVEDVSLLFAVDWLVDRCRTVNNMLGDCYASAIIEHYSRDELTAGERLPLHQEETKEAIKKNIQIMDQLC
ncbi:Excitatory amino acid transporter, putative [Pediculus humanus corporis]|uniref:Amino acid transporter n=1 Tax=Pediculus humanus subsp. corporis TaxID=121224 RepID=E0VNX7_PEDHC|nr:Excitatory amino acid transporter, putative [Pediculus humanus corporis]EEB15083.1 Excitatory amino acid transporter, putative [Pediculus humanus corporis]